MNNLRAKGLFKQPQILVLLAATIFSGLLLILVNFYTIKILNATRAYVNGESHYSKSQKDATRYLISYMHTGDQNQWQKFHQEILIPLADGRARMGMVSDAPDDQIKKELIQGRNNDDDLDDIIWLYRQFKDVSYMKSAIHQWEQADPLIKKLNAIGNEVYYKLTEGTLTPEIKEKYLAEIGVLAAQLTIFQQEFSEQLGQSSRALKGYLLWTNIFFILAIILSVSIYYLIIVKKLTDSNLEIEQVNNDLMIANKELDHFVHSATHDLRSPIALLKGIINIIRQEDDPEKVEELLNMMQVSLNRQDQFISDIIDYSKNKRSGLIIEPLSLGKIIDEVLSQLHHVRDTNHIEIKKDIEVDEIFGDGLRIKIVLNNLLSNAVKYSDDNKAYKFISVKTYTINKSYVIEVEDNGIGIDAAHHEAIFEMFFVTNINKGSGLGLSIVQEAAQKMNGSISVTSELGKGSRFILTIPIN
ncbi:HAMP domain-containing histidine kinase [Flavobacterium sp. CYK-55]|uniref:sensor histidine kinase n=1 Tax=Flavobacterium sp. CYK-55 TaxID=2835529 RepID=UPI001BD06DA8|nr:HAMP domain-containing sensor histidine kinase [Flavobacterium sp. CYK-55]MBS7788027.1 HAMP domain-containing histidine kinase [Flavobacterium sp. CYK-55]